MHLLLDYTKQAAVLPGGGNRPNFRRAKLAALRARRDNSRVRMVPDDAMRRVFGDWQETPHL